jgi:hypothetical protein
VGIRNQHGWKRASVDSLRYTRTTRCLLVSAVSRAAITKFRRGADGAFDYQKCVASTLATPGVPLMTFTCSTI